MCSYAAANHVVSYVKCFEQVDQFLAFAKTQRKPKAERMKRVRFTNPISPTDKFQVEVSTDPPGTIEPTWTAAQEQEKAPPCQKCGGSLNYTVTGSPYIRCARCHYIVVAKGPEDTATSTVEIQQKMTGDARINMPAGYSIDVEKLKEKPECEHKNIDPKSVTNIADMEVTKFANCKDCGRIFPPGELKKKLARAARTFWVGLNKLNHLNEDHGYYPFAMVYDGEWAINTPPEYDWIKVRETLPNEES
jgi:DNA-directed RNA polymerase subunit M/transcription elongation factor TFIIS